MMNVCYNPVTVSRHNYSITTQNNTFTSFDLATSRKDDAIATHGEAKQETFFDGITTEEMNLLAISAEEAMIIVDFNRFANELGFVQVFGFTCSLSYSLSIMTALTLARVLSFTQALFFANNCDEDACNTDCNTFVMTDNKNDDKSSLIYYSRLAKYFLSFITDMFVAIGNLKTVIENLNSNQKCIIRLNNIKRRFLKICCHVIAKTNCKIGRLVLCYRQVV